MRTKTLAVTTGVGELKFSGFTGQVGWRIDGDLDKLRRGAVRLRGALTTTTDIARDAFKAGEGLLTLESGERYRLTMLGHTDGGDEVFVELRL